MAELVESPRIGEGVERETGEDRRERTARELNELLQELRVVLPGIQVLFAFLLTVPFSARFAETTQLQQYIFFGTLICTAVATVLLIAPSAHHRMLWRRNLREERLRTANGLTIAGLAFLVPAMAGAVFLVSDLTFGSTVAGAATAAAALLTVYLWFVHPLVGFVRETGEGR